MESVLVGVVIVLMLIFVILIAIFAFGICAVMCMKRLADMTIELFERDKRIRELEAEVQKYANKGITE